MMYFSISIHKGPTMTMMVVIRYAGGGTGQAKREGRPSAASSTSRVSLTLASFPPARPRSQDLYFDLDRGPLIALTLGIISSEENKLVLGSGRHKARCSIEILVCFIR